MPLGQRAVAAPVLAVLVAELARAVFAEIDAANRAALGRSVPVRVLVDGREGALESVNPRNGVIEFEWQTIDEVLIWIWQTLKDRSPARSGRYRNSHLLLADGTEVAPGGAIPPATQYVFVNSQPYARKIEIGTTESGRDFVIQVPNRIYERVARDAMVRFYGVAKISFTFYALDQDSARQPAIIVNNPRPSANPVEQFFSRASSLLDFV